MQPLRLHYFPLTWPFLVICLLLLAVLVGLIAFNVLDYAYRKMGIRRDYVLTLLALSFLGSYINIPVARLPERQVVTSRVIDFFGVQYVVPAIQEWPGTVIAVNVGGAVIPTILSFYLLLKNRLFWQGAIGVIAVTLVVHQLAYPVRGVGIATPIFVPPLIASGAALILTRRQAPALAYAAGSLGTLIGADLLNLGKIQGLGAPVASIGGAGTFDGVFLTGVVAVLLTHDFSGKEDDEEERPGGEPI